jgi:hypothetical protein
LVFRDSHSIFPKPSEHLFAISILFTAFFVIFCCGDGDDVGGGG